MMNALKDFFPVLVFIVIALGFTIVPIIIASLIAPRTVGKKTHATYECGIEPFGGAWIRYSVAYYIYALIFIAFDVDILYLFPILLAYTKQGNIQELYTLIIFVAILALAIIYAWGKGVFSWKRKILS